MGEMVDAQYASNAKANTGVALGATGLGIAVANALSGGNGLLGGIFGNNNQISRAGAFAESQYVSQLQAENAMLRADNETDRKLKDVYAQTLSDNRMLRTELYSSINPLIAETHTKAVADAEKIARLEEQVKCCCEKNELRLQITDQKIDAQSNLLAGKINETALALNGKIDTNLATLNGNINTMQAVNKGKFDVIDQTISCIRGDVYGLTKRLDGITEEYVPHSKVCHNWFGCLPFTSGSFEASASGSYQRDVKK